MQWAVSTDGITKILARNTLQFNPYGTSSSSGDYCKLDKLKKGND